VNHTTSCSFSAPLRNPALAALALVTVLGCSPESDTAEIRPGGEQAVRHSPPPRFEDYPVEEIYRGPVAPVNLTGRPELIRFQHVLASVAAAGPNFAGRYALVPADCGPGCIDVMLVDLGTGSVQHLLSGVAPVHYRLESRLLVVEPRLSAPGEPRCAECSAAYHVWQGDRLEQLAGDGWSEARPPESVLRQLRAQRADEPTLIAADSPTVQRPRPDRLLVHTAAGAPRVFDDDFLGESLIRFHRYRGSPAPLNAYVVEQVFVPEGWEFFLVEAGTGRLTRVDDVPSASPDGARFATASIDLVAGHRPNRARIYRMGPAAPTVEWEISPEGWGLTDPRWIDARTLTFTRVDLDTRTAPFTESRSSATLTLESGRWTLR
jgi:hypothetical protein